MNEEETFISFLGVPKVKCWEDSRINTGVKNIVIFERIGYFGLIGWQERKFFF